MLPPEDDDEYEETPVDKVYVVLDEARCQVKIGVTCDVRRRLNQLKCQRGNRALELLGTMRGGRMLERTMHARFRQHRRDGREWYSTEILAELMPLLDAA